MTWNTESIDDRASPPTLHQCRLKTVGLRSRPPAIIHSIERRPGPSRARPWSGRLVFRSAKIFGARPPCVGAQSASNRRISTSNRRSRGGFILGNAQDREIPGLRHRYWSWNTGSRISCLVATPAPRKSAMRHLARLGGDVQLRVTDRASLFRLAARSKVALIDLLSSGLRRVPSVAHPLPGCNCSPQNRRLRQEMKGQAAEPGQLDAAAAYLGQLPGPVGGRRQWPSVQELSPCRHRAPAERQAPPRLCRWAK